MLKLRLGAENPKWFSPAYHFTGNFHEHNVQGLQFSLKGESVILLQKTLRKR